jgi:hypothetical protein
MRRPRIVLLGAGIALAAIVAIAVVVADRLERGDDPASSVAPVAATARASATAPPPTRPGSEVAWWDTGDFGFGFTGFEPEPVPAVPDGYRQLRVGTLDGRITAIRTLPDGWSRSYVSGPMDGEVLVAADDGATSTVSIITAATRAERIAFASTDIVPAATIAPDADEIWYVRLRRADGRDLGVWRRPMGGGDEERMLAGPLGEPFEADPITIWQLHFDADGRWLVVQWCFGEVRCRTHVLDVSSGAMHTTEELGFPWGFTDALLVSRGVGGGPVMALDLASGDVISWRSTLESGVVVEARGSWWVAGAAGMGGPTRVLELVPGATLKALPGEPDPEMSEFHILFDAGVGPMPMGWALRHPSQLGTWPEDRAPVARGELVDLATGERIVLAPFRPELAAPDCPVVGPAETPSGRPAGPYRSELRDGVRHAQWSSGEDVVTVAVGVPVIGGLADLAGMAETTVRGHPARIVPIGDDGVGQIALVWEEGACTYTAYLAAGTAVEAALEYASRY